MVTMVIIIKKKLNGEYLGFEIVEIVDKSDIKIEKLLDNRIIMDVKEIESPEYECIVYEITLSNEVQLNG